MRWKALFFLHKYVRSKKEIEKLNFKTRKHPPVINDLAGFEKNMVNVMNKIRFIKVKRNLKKTNSCYRGEKDKEIGKHPY